MPNLKRPVQGTIDLKSACRFWRTVVSNGSPNGMTLLTIGAVDHHNTQNSEGEVSRPIKERSDVAPAMG